MKSILTFYLLCFPTLLFAQLDLKSVSFNIVMEIPGEKHFSDTVEYEFLMKTIQVAGDTDTIIHENIECLFYLSNDTSEEYKDYRNYSMARDIHIGDFNEDGIDDCIYGFSVWGCYAYSSKAYISKGNSYEILEFRNGFLTDIEFSKGKITAVQNIIYESCMYGLNSIFCTAVKSGKTHYKYRFQYLYEKDSLMQTNFDEKLIKIPSDSIYIYFRDAGCILGEEKPEKGTPFALRNKTIQVLKYEADWALVIAEVKDEIKHQDPDNIPEKFYISGWIKKEDLK